jgi:hypothetical protein
VLRDPAKDPLKIYRLTVDDEIGRVEAAQLQPSNSVANAA